MTGMEIERNARVLLVEDNRGDALLTCRAFKKAHKSRDITVAETGEKGLSILRREDGYGDADRPDIILLDLNLPGIGGHDFLAQVKADPALRCIPIIVLSSSSARADVVGSYKRHANGYITKPVTIDAYDGIVAKIEDYWFQLMQLPADDEDTVEYH
jgi:CheY-like chemotaxis protein